jgi:copper resistance protein D
VTPFLDIFAFLSVVLRGLGLAFEALTLGGVIFLLLIASPLGGDQVTGRLLRWVTSFSLLLALTQACTVAANSAILIGSMDLQLSEVSGAEFWIAGTLVVVAALITALAACTRWWRMILPLASLFILIGSVMGSHSMARLENRPLLLALTLLHHLASAAWMGGLFYLLLSLRFLREGPVAAAFTDRFSRLAMVSVAALIGAGASMSWFYVGSMAATFGTTYGIMLGAKVILTLVLLGVGGLNLRIVQGIRQGLAPRLLSLRRFGEAEIGVGFTVILVAASLTSTPPAIDVLGNRVSPHEIAQRIKPQWPRMDTPRLSDLSPPSPVPSAITSVQPSSFVPGQVFHPNRPADIAWSEYNHHWAGLVVLAIGILALASYRFRWARHWPLTFLGLAVFLLIRADSESWPLGPRGFWESFLVAEVAQHRLFVLLIVLFAFFEWSVRTGRTSLRRASLVFPLVCATGGALLMTHSHSLGNAKEEFLAELSHMPLAVLAVVAGWSRWIEIRVPDAYPRVTAWIWPICFVLIGTVLMLYRES